MGEGGDGERGERAEGARVVQGIGQARLELDARQEPLGRLTAAIAEADSIKPVTAYVRCMACSAAYWIASQCRAICAEPSALIGSIGVY